MEVIFKGGSRYYRAEGLLSQTLKMKIPAGIYDASNAILLIGKRSDKTLLAIGTTNIDTDTLTPTNNTITFTIKSLTAALYAGGEDHTSASGLDNTPTFVIDEDTPTQSSTVDSLKTKGFTAAIIKDGTFTDEDTTCFQVATDTAGIGAKLNIKGFDGAGVKIAKVDKTGTIPAVTFTASKGTPPAIIVDKSDIDFYITGGTGTIDFIFNTAGEGGYIITFDIPVVGFVVYDDTSDPTTTPGLVDQLTWHILGGTIPAPASYQPLEGSGEAGVALIVTSEPNKLVTVHVGPNPPSEW